MRVGRDGAPLRKASTVILMRSAAGGKPLVCLVTRSHQSSFMLGLYVFPGGRLEPQDMEMALWEDHLDEPVESFLVRLGQGLEPMEAMGHAVAAVRETLEEVRVFLAYSTSDDAQIRLSSVSPVCGKHPEGWFTDIVVQLGATLRVSALAPRAHWITPEAMPLRFDTRFHLALHTEEQSCVPDRRETTHALWIEPSEALLANHRGSVPHSPPTMVPLQELTGFRDLDSLKAQAWRRTWGEPRLPKLRMTSRGPLLLFPWDPGYAFDNPEQDMEPEADPVELPPLEPFSRLLRRDGLWLPVRA